jgi:hypothetical protein
MTATVERAAEPATGLTVWERWRTGYEARSDEERQRYREYDAAIDRLARLRDAAEVTS